MEIVIIFLIIVWIAYKNDQKNPKPQNNSNVAPQNNTVPKSVPNNNHKHDVVSNTNSLSTNALFNDVRTMPITFNYEITVNDRHYDIDRICSVLVSDEAILPIIKNRLTTSLNKISKLQKNYSSISEKDILFELFKYSYLMNTLLVLIRYKDHNFNVDFNEYWFLIDEECQFYIDDEQKSPIANSLLNNYHSKKSFTKKDNVPLNTMENDYIIITIKINIMIRILRYIRKGATIRVNALEDRIIEFLAQYPSNEVCMVLDRYISNIINQQTYLSLQNADLTLTNKTVSYNAKKSVSPITENTDTKTSNAQKSTTNTTSQSNTVKPQNMNLTVNDYGDYLDALDKWHEYYDDEIFSDDVLKDFIGCYFLYTRFGITVSDIKQDLKDIINSSQNESIISIKMDNATSENNKLNNKTNHTEKSPLFLMKIVDMFPIKGRGIVVTGTIAEGEVHLKDVLYLTNQSGKEIGVTVNGIEMNRKMFDMAIVGDSVGLLINGLFEGISEKDVCQGDILTNDISIKKMPNKTSNENKNPHSSAKPKTIDTTTLFNEVKTMPVKFDYTVANTGNYQDINTICSTFMSDNAIKSAMNDSVIMTMEQNIQAKRSRNPRKEDHDKSMENNLLFELYKYAYLMNTIVALEKHKNDVVQIDFQNYWLMIQNDCIVRIKNLEQEKRNNPQINTLLRKYVNDNRMVSMRVLSQINARENDYIIAGLMTNVLNTMLYSIFSGATIQLNNSSSQQKIMQIITKYPSKEVCMIIDSHIMNMVVLRTSVYGGGNPLGWN